MEKPAKGPKNRRIGVLGGSFDPVHNAHIALAEAAYRQLGLDEIIFMPARQAALKPSDACASPEQRAKMLEIALESADFPHSISDIETRRRGISYSIDTVRELLALRPDSEIFWIIGSDHLPKLSKWKDIAEFCKLAKFACARRARLRANRAGRLTPRRALVNRPAQCAQKRRGGRFGARPESFGIYFEK